MTWRDVLLTVAVAAGSAGLFLVISFQNEGPIFRTRACVRLALAVILTTALISAVSGLILAQIPLAVQPLPIAALVPGVLSVRRLKDADLGTLGAVASVGIAVLVRRLDENVSEAGNDWAVSMIEPNWSVKQTAAAGTHYYNKLRARVWKDLGRMDQVDAHHDQFQRAVESNDKPGAQESLRIMLEHAYRWGGYHWSRYDPRSAAKPRPASRTPRSGSRSSSVRSGDPVV